MYFSDKPSFELEPRQNCQKGCYCECYFASICYFWSVLTFFCYFWRLIFRPFLTFFRLGLRLGKSWPRVELRLDKSWPCLTSLKRVIITALNQYWYLDLELDLPSTDIDLAFGTGSPYYHSMLQQSAPRNGNSLVIAINQYWNVITTRCFGKILQYTNSGPTHAVAILRMTSFTISDFTLKNSF